MRKFKMQISTQTDNQEYRKNVATNENCILKKMDLKFQNLPSTIRKIAFWSRQK